MADLVHTYKHTSYIPEKNGFEFKPTIRVSNAKKTEKTGLVSTNFYI